MSTLKVEPRYQGSPMLIVPSAAGFPLVFKFAATRGRCWLSTAFGLAMAVAALWAATVLVASAAVVGALRGRHDNHRRREIPAANGCPFRKSY
jgi:hypothetical protein